MNERTEWLFRRNEDRELLFTSIAKQVEADLASQRTINISAMQEKYPDCGEQIGPLVKALEVMHELGRSPKNHSRPEDADLRVLGDFELLREIGRGGMGVVYEARQISLNRKVALKILPMAAVFDQRQLRRFRNEAQAAANLHHSNIVPVYGIGCERGVHYYAMQHIEGQTLSELITSVRMHSDNHTAADEQSITKWYPTSGQPEHSTWPEFETDTSHATSPAISNLHHLSTIYSTNKTAYFKSIAKLMIQVAEALDYAHQEGVLHRDIKPANLIVDLDGRIWITDFGLARIETDAGLTASGDVVGTLGYMSPEQLSAKRGIIDHRVDIYSLGATMYELLTLRPMVENEDRKKLLRRIEGDEPRPLRKVSRAVPEELETITLKALAPDATDRYATAKDLADDLGKYLDDLPIRARKSSSIDRARKWLRRHRSIVCAVGIALICSLSVSTIALLYQQQELRKARHAAEDNFTREFSQRKIAEAEKSRAEQSFLLARKAVDELLTEVASEDLLDVPHMTPLRRSLLKKALSFYQELLRSHYDQDEILHETGLAFLRVGDIESELGEFSTAQAAYLCSMDQFRFLCSRGTPCDADFARAQSNLAKLYRQVGRTDESEELLAKAERRIKRLYENDSSDLETAFVLSSILLNRASIHGDAGEFSKAESAFRESLKILNRLVAIDTENISYRNSLATAHHNLALLLANRGEFAQAKMEAKKGLQLREALICEFPDVTRFTAGAAADYNSLGFFLHSLERYEHARNHWQRSLELWSQLADRHPELPEYQIDLAATHHNLGIVDTAEGNHEKAIEHFNFAQSIHRELINKFPAVPDYQRDYALTANSLAAVLFDHDDLSALLTLRKAIEIQEKLVESYPRNVDYRVDLAASLYSLGKYQERTASIDETYRAWSRAKGLLRAVIDQRGQHPRASELLMRINAFMDMS